MGEKEKDTQVIEKEYTPEDLVDKCNMLITRCPGVKGHASETEKFTRRDFYFLGFVISGKLPDGTKYQLKVERWNEGFMYGMESVRVNHDSSVRVDITSKKKAKIKFKVDKPSASKVYWNQLSNVTVQELEYCNQDSDSEARKVQDYAQKTYNAIIKDLEEKDPDLIKTIIGTRILLRTQNLDDML